MSLALYFRDFTLGIFHDLFSHFLSNCLAKYSADVLVMKITVSPSIFSHFFPVKLSGYSVRGFLDRKSVV